MVITTGITASLTFFVFFIYNCLLFALSDAFLEKKSPGRLARAGIALFNTCVYAVILYVFSMPTVAAYLILIFGLLAEFSLLYRDAFLSRYFCVSAFALHIMSARAIASAIFSFATGLSIYQLAHDPFLLTLSILAAFVCLCLCIVCVLRCLPGSYIKIINQHREQVLFMCIWLTVFNIYLLINSRVYSLDFFHPALALNQLIAPLGILIGLYVVLFFAIQTGKLLGYKEKSRELQREIQAEKLYRDSIINDALVSYEYNLTRDTPISGFEVFEKRFGIKAATYTDLVAQAAPSLVHPDDYDDFLRRYAISFLLGEFAADKREVVHEYRRLDDSGVFRWVRSVTAMGKDPTTDDIRAFTYVKDIDDEKKRQLQLQFKAERDSLTGLYNKEMTGKLVDGCIQTGQSPAGALYIVDIDNFKSINDHLGHTFGDAVLCEFSEKLLKLFRTGDIIGRIGGDEFIAYMKNVADIRVIRKKAADMCRLFQGTYTSESGRVHAISGSVGIALCPENGTNFAQLYKNADIALYTVKNDGKSGYGLYDGRDFAEYESIRTAIDTGGADLQKNFVKNRIEYVFKILYDSESPIKAIHAVLELVSAHFGFDRGYIFETSADGRTTGNTFEWCAPGIEPQIRNLARVPIENVSTANASFHKTGTFLISNVDELPAAEQAILKPQGIKSMFQFGIFDKDKLLGFIGFDNCRSYGACSAGDINDIKIICNILSTFFVKQRLAEAGSRNLAMLSTVMDNLDNFMYVIDSETYEVLYLNEKTRRITGVAGPGCLCYKEFRGNDAPCADCPISKLSADSSSKASAEIYNDVYNLWLEVFASYIDWIDGRTTCLINSIDITRFKVPAQNTDAAGSDR